MKTHKIWLNWLRHREAVIIIGSLLFLLFALLSLAEILINKYPYESFIFIIFILLTVRFAAKYNKIK